MGIRRGRMRRISRRKQEGEIEKDIKNEIKKERLRRLK